MLGIACLICDEGTYERALYEEWVACSHCGHEVARWLTKREMLEVQCEDNASDKD